jgi:hypothetical protein
MDENANEESFPGAIVADFSTLIGDYGRIIPANVEIIEAHPY